MTVVKLISLTKKRKLDWHNAATPLLCKQAQEQIRNIKKSQAMH